MTVQRRLKVGFSAMFVLFVTLLVVQFGAGARLRAENDRRAERATRAEVANDRVLQRMTDAETGVRGYQLTGEQIFLEPYEKGWTAALTALDDVAANSSDPRVGELLTRQREAVGDWLDGYAAPIVVAGVPGGRDVPAVQGKRMFDTLREINAAVAGALGAEHRNLVAAGAAERRRLDIASGILAAAILAVGYAVARIGRRHLLVPLGKLGTTLRALAAGDRSARAEPVDAAELRTVVEALNELAAQTEVLLAAEHARAARAGLRQAVAAELQEMSDPAAAGRRIVELIGAAVGAEAVHAELDLPGSGVLRVSWPPGTTELAARTCAALLAGGPGDPRVHPDGSVSLALAVDGAPGYLRLVRAAAPVWTEAEQRLLAGVGREIERALRQLSLQHHQARLISELRMLDQRKDVFIQTVTHELRTPLTSILGYTEMIADEDGGGLTPLQERAVNAILRNAHRLQGTIGDLVLLDRPDNGAAMYTESLDLAAVATMVRHELRSAAAAKDLTVTFDADEGWVHGDRTQLQRALRKLMENAIKFTPAGGSVTCRLTADTRCVAVSVIDTGIGIPAEDVSGLFTPFHRAGNAMDQAVQGPGLGLAIVRDIVRDHGGTIAVQSVVGRGSTFTLTLPAAAPVMSPAPV